MLARDPPSFLLYETTELASTKPLTASGTCPDWRQAGWPYYACHLYLRHRFGQRVQKVSVDAGFTCPNVDGTVATGGCNFCDNRSFSPSRRLPRMGIVGQLDEGIARMRTRYPNCRALLAYFQPSTNTYAPVERLRALYDEALAHPQVVGLVIGTRPDCVPDDVLDLLEELAKSETQDNSRDPVEVTVSDSRDPTGRRCPGTYISLELGMQTMHDRSLDWIGRGHHHDAMIDAVERCRGRGFEIGSHVILGLPGESHDDMLATARELARLGVDAVKIHNLYCVKNTRLADEVAAGRVRLMERDEYVATLVDFLELLPPTMVIDRISGDAPRDFFVGPDWCLDKPAVKAAVLAEFKRRGTWQGHSFAAAR
jgi:radical SAM superfamily enzyme